MRLPSAIIPFLLASVSFMASAQTPAVTFIRNFNEPDGAVPASNLIQIPSGQFVGIATTPTKGGLDGGMVFELAADGSITSLYTFTSDGSQCAGAGQNGIFQGMDGSFYGVCPAGGKYGRGSVFRLSRSGKFLLLHSFQGSDGASPAGALVQGFDGSLYGVTTQGGSSRLGTLFKIGTGGEFTSLYQFGNGGPEYPQPGLTLGSDGTIYGIYALYESQGFFAGGGLVAIGQNGAIGFPTYFLAEPLTSPPVFGPHSDFFALNQPTVGVGQTTETVEAANPDSEYANVVQNLPSYNGSDFVNYAGGMILTNGGFFVNGFSIIQSPTQPYVELQLNPATQEANFFNLQPYGSSPNLTPLQGEDGQIYVASSAGGSAGTGSVIALNYGLAPPPPSITGFTPTSGPKGTVVTVYGNAFVGANFLTLNSKPVPSSTVASGFIKFVVGGTDTSGHIAVKTAGGVAISAGSFSVE